MTVLFLRCLILYVTVIVGVRLMGKRQIGELQPEELVVTILISDVATMPLQDMQIPLLQPLMIIAVIVACELLFSVLSLKSRRFRTLVQGHAIPIVKNGTLDPSLLPSTGTPFPGGMRWRQVLGGVDAGNTSRNIVGFDIVELCPNPHDKSSDVLAAVLLYKILAKIGKKVGRCE